MWLQPAATTLSSHVEAERKQTQQVLRERTSGGVETDREPQVVVDVRRGGDGPMASSLPSPTRGSSQLSVVTRLLAAGARARRDQTACSGVRD